MKFFSGEKISRRSFLKNGFRLSLLAFLGIGFEGRNNFKTEHVHLDFPNLPSSFHGFRIVQIKEKFGKFLRLGRVKLVGTRFADRCWRAEP